MMWRCLANLINQTHPDAQRSTSTLLRTPAAGASNRGSPGCQAASGAAGGRGRLSRTLAQRPTLHRLLAGTHVITMSKPRFQRMSQEQETVLGHNCALDIYSEPEATRKVRPCSTHRAAAAIRALHLLCEPCVCGLLPAVLHYWHHRPEDQVRGDADQAARGGIEHRSHEVSTHPAHSTPSFGPGWSVGPPCCRRSGHG